MAAEVGHEQASVWAWRFDLYTAAGISAECAATLAGLELGSRDVLDLYESGCPDQLLIAILA